jgi:hypothetical protein
MKEKVTYRLKEYVKEIFDRTYDQKVSDRIQKQLNEFSSKLN